MFGIRTPKKCTTERSQSSPSTSHNVRRSAGEWEKRNSIETINMDKPEAPTETSTPPTLNKTFHKTQAEIHAEEPKKQQDRTSVARKYLQKAKIHLGEARNLKTEIKVEVTKSLDGLYQLVKQAESEKTENSVSGEQKTNKETQKENGKQGEERRMLLKIQEKIDENNRLIQENGKKMEEIKEEIEKQKEKANNATYAAVAAKAPEKLPERALHSIIISSKDEDDTGEEILSKVREAVNAKDGWVKVEKVRKAKGRKIIMGCKTQEERNKVRERIETGNKHLVVEEARNKDPLLILRDVLSYNSDEDVLASIRNQNKELFRGLTEEDTRISLKYRKKTRNPHTSHIVVSTSPALWKTIMELGSLHIDLQKVRAYDQSPLVQCTRCLGYGHGRRFCKEPFDACSHCGGPHLGVECPEKATGVAPACRNCTRAKMADVEHNAFSDGCPVRRRWDAIARSTVAYC